MICRQSVSPSLGLGGTCASVVAMLVAVVFIYFSHDWQPLVLCFLVAIKGNVKGSTKVGKPHSVWVSSRVLPVTAKAGSGTLEAAAALAKFQVKKAAILTAAALVSTFGCAMSARTS